MGKLTFDDVAKRVISGELSQQMGADSLGIKRTTFAYQLNKKYPNRPKGVNVRKENRKPATGRPKKPTYLESHFSDLDLCNILSMHGECSRKCPLYKACEGEHKYQGLVKAMLNKLPLKDAQNTLEAT